MFTSLVLCICSLTIILFELTFPIQSIEYDTKCYPVGNRRVCFFRPHFNYTRETWYKARVDCLRKNGTLPFFPDKSTQDAFKEHINSLMPRFNDDIWMSGREMRSKEWTWANGLPFNEPTDFAQTHLDFNSYHLQAILTDDLVYKKENLSIKHNYVCQFFGTPCQSNNFIPLKNGCLSMSDGETLGFYDARNKCLERGGDLPVIDGQEDLNKFRQAFPRTRTYGSAGLWLGLRRQWWSSNITDIPELKFTNWYMDNGFKPTGGCMVTEVKDDYQWKQENCTGEYKRFICQTGPANVEVSTMPTRPPSIGFLSLSSSGFVFFIAGISVMVLAIIVVIVVVTVIARKRKTRMMQTKSNGESRDSSYLHLEGKYRGQNNQISDKQYTELQPTTKKMPLPTPDRSLMSQRKEQSPEYIYDEIVDTRAPSYLEVTD